VLVAQDGATLPAAVADALRMAGLRPPARAHTKECLAALEEQPHSPAWDASFEGGGGEQLCRTIKERRARSPLPVIWSRRTPAPR
jgi:DNA-binding response OmpR family regulator